MIKEMIEQLPEAAQYWMSTLSPGARAEIEPILRETGVQNFSKYWKYHRDHLREFEREWGYRL